MRSILKALCFLSALLVNGAWGSWPDPAALVRVDLLSEDSAIAPARPFWIGVRLAMREHWHTYWRNPGDAGLATEIAWRLPEGFAAGPVAWPTPSQINVGPLVNYGYEGEAVLLVRITPPPTLAGPGPVRLGADVSYLVCDRECIPGEAHLALDIAVAQSDADARPDPSTADLFAAARARLPRAAPWRVTHRAGPDSITLDLAGKPLAADGAYRARFLPHSDALIVHAAEQRLEKRADGASIAMRRSALAATPPETVAGVLVIEENVGGAQAQQAFEIVSKAAQMGAGDASGARKSPPRPARASLLRWD
jgi:thiol:disulfide interchange protein DsbD